MQQRVLAIEMQTERQKANKTYNSLNQRELRAEKINSRLWKETNIWCRAACQICDEREKSVEECSDQ